MGFEDESPKNSQPEFVPGQKLDDFSVDELKNIITQLQTEITRLEADIVNKQSTKSSADALFKF